MAKEAPSGSEDLFDSIKHDEDQKWLGLATSLSEVGKMNKVDKMLHDINITRKQYQDVNNQMHGEFKTSHHKNEPFCVNVSGPTVSFPSSCPMERKEALRMAYWLIDMLEEK